MFQPVPNPRWDDGGKGGGHHQAARLACGKKGPRLCGLQKLVHPPTVQALHSTGKRVRPDLVPSMTLHPAHRGCQSICECVPHAGGASGRWTTARMPRVGPANLHVWALQMLRRRAACCHMCGRARRRVA
eukprot:42797-Chlamydomonas_euryale.AAC.1